MNEIKNLTTGIGSLFAVLVLLMVASVVIIITALSVSNIPEFLQMSVIFFFCFVLLTSLITMIVILFCKPSKLFVRDISDLENQQGRLTKVASELGDKLTTTEQALMPILTGNDPNSSSRVKSGRIIIGSKDFAEQVIFGNLLVCWLERSLPGIIVDRRIPNGSTMKNFADLKNGWIDGYVEYTGTGYWLLQISERKDSLKETIEELNIRSKRFKVTWLSPLGTTNNYMVVVSKSLAKKMGLDNKKVKEDENKLRIIDIQKALKGSQRLNVCGPPETMNRSDSWAGLKREYHLNSVNVKIVGYGDRYEALRTGYADITLGFETDPELDDADFEVLEDSQGFFPKYHSIPLFRDEALQEISGLGDAVHTLGDKLVENRVTDMITEYKARGSDPDIARAIAERYVDEIRAQNKQSDSG